MIGNAVLFATMCTLSFAILGEASKVEDVADSEGLLSMLSHGAGAPSGVQRPIHEGIRALQQAGITALGSPHAVNYPLDDIFAETKRMSSFWPYGPPYPSGKAYESTLAAKAEELAQKAGADLDPFKGWSLEGATEKHGQLSRSTIFAIGNDLLAELEIDLQGVKDEHESNKAAIKAESPFWEGKDEASQHKGGLYAVAAAPLKVVNAVASAPAKVLKRLFKTSIAHHEYYRDGSWLLEETKRNSYRLHALLAFKTEKQIDMEWKHAHFLKNRRPHGPVSFNGVKETKDLTTRLARKRRNARKEREFHEYVVSLMGDSWAASFAVKQSLMGEDNIWQQRRWDQFLRRLPKGRKRHAV